MKVTKKKGIKESMEGIRKKRKGERPRETKKKKEKE